MAETQTVTKLYGLGKKSGLLTSRTLRALLPSPIEPLSLCHRAEFRGAKLGFSACPVAASGTERLTAAQGWDLWHHPVWFDGVQRPKSHEKLRFSNCVAQEGFYLEVRRPIAGFCSYIVGKQVQSTLQL